MKTGKQVYILILSALLILSMMPFYVFADAQIDVGTDSGAEIEAMETDNTDSDDGKSSELVDVEPDSDIDAAGSAETGDAEAREQVNEDKASDDGGQPSDEKEAVSDSGKDSKSTSDTVPFTGKAGGVEVNVEAPKSAFPEGTK